MNDEQLIQRAASGDRTAMELLAAECYPAVLAFCVKLTHARHEAQDLAQSVMLRMIERLHQYRHRGSSFTSWLFSIAYHLFIDGTRRRKEHPQGDEAFAAVPAPGDAYGDVDRSDQARALLEALPDELRAMVTLRYYMEMGHEEIARIMNTSPKRVKWRLNDALETMRRAEKRLATGSGEGTP